MSMTVHSTIPYCTYILKLYSTLICRVAGLLNTFQNNTVQKFPSMTAFNLHEMCNVIDQTWSALHMELENPPFYEFPEQKPINLDSMLRQLWEATFSFSHIQWQTWTMFQKQSHTCTHIATYSKHFLRWDLFLSHISLPWLQRFFFLWLHSRANVALSSASPRLTLTEWLQLPLVHILEYCSKPWDALQYEILPLLLVPPESASLGY